MQGLGFSGFGAYRSGACGVDSVVSSRVPLRAQVMVVGFGELKLSGF